MKYPINRYRPTRASDGEGGFTVTLGTPVVMYAMFTAHKGETSALIDLYEDILINDVIGVTMEEDSTEGQYRVTALERQLGTQFKKASLERIQRPITP